MPLVSIIIPTNRRQAVLEPCLQALAGQHFDASEMEVIVVHNGPGSPPARPAAAWPFELIIERVSAASASIARNVALDCARGEWVVFLNDDVLPQPELVAAHLAAHQRVEPPAMVLGKSAWPRYQDETVLDRLMQTTSMYFFYDQMQPHAWYNFRHAWTLNLSLPRRCLETHRFDERIPFYFEDLELAFRLEQRHGMRVWYAPEALVVHDHRHTFEGYLRREANMGKFALRLWRCNPGCFRAIYGSDLDQAYLDYCRRFVETEGRRSDEMHAWLSQIVARRMDELGCSPEVQPAFIKSLYFAHLPLKRLAFRTGLLDAVEHERVTSGAAM